MQVYPGAPIMQSQQIADQSQQMNSQYNQNPQQFQNTQSIQMVPIAQPFILVQSQTQPVNQLIQSQNLQRSPQKKHTITRSMSIKLGEIGSLETKLKDTRNVLIKPVATSLPNPFFGPCQNICRKQIIEYHYYQIPRTELTSDEIKQQVKNPPIIQASTPGIYKEFLDDTDPSKQCVMIGKVINCIGSLASPMCGGVNFGEKINNAASKIKEYLKKTIWCVYNYCPCCIEKEFREKLKLASDQKEGKAKGFKVFEGIGEAVGTFSQVYDQTGHRGYLSLYRKSFLGKIDPKDGGCCARLGTWCIRQVAVQLELYVEQFGLIINNELIGFLFVNKRLVSSCCCEKFCRKYKMEYVLFDLQNNHVCSISEQDDRKRDRFEISLQGLQLGSITPTRSVCCGCFTSESFYQLEIRDDIPIVHKNILMAAIPVVRALSGLNLGSKVMNSGNSSIRYDKNTDFNSKISFDDQEKVNKSILPDNQASQFVEQPQASNFQQSMIIQNVSMMPYNDQSALIKPNTQF